MEVFLQLVVLVCSNSLEKGYGKIRNYGLAHYKVWTITLDTCKLRMSKLLINIMIYDI